MRLPFFFYTTLMCIMLVGCDEDSSKKANLTLEISDITIGTKEGRLVVNHTRSFQETNGIDVTITRGKICVESKGTCVDAFVTYEVEGNGTLVQPNHHVATRQEADLIQFEYWAKDDHGFEHKLTKSMKIENGTATVIKPVN